MQDQAPKKGLSIRKKILILIISVFAFVYIISLALVIYINNNWLNDYLIQSLRYEKQNFDSLIENDSKMLSSTLQALLVNNEIKKLYIEGDRDRLYFAAEPIFNMLKSNFRITHWYFIKPEPGSQCFLRVHQATNYGDIIKRFTYLSSVKSKEFASGLELGVTAYALRTVHPYYDQNDKLIGYMELGEEIDYFFNYLKSRTGNDYGMVLLKKYLDRSHWSSSRTSQRLYDNWNDTPLTVIADSTSSNIPLKINLDLENVPDQGLVYNKFTSSGKNIALFIIPFYDAGNRKSGGVFVLKDITRINNMFLGYVIDILICYFIILITAVIIIFIITGRIGKNIKLLKEMILKGAAGDLTERLNISSNDEIADLSWNFNTMRENLNSDLINIEKSSGQIDSSSENSMEIIEKNNRSIDEINTNILALEKQTEVSSSAVEELTASIEQISRNTDSIMQSMIHQASSVEEDASSIEEMVRNIDNTSIMSKNSTDISNKLNKASLEGSDAVKSTVNSITDVYEYSNQIIKLLGLITTIAEQTNLLAMNASIEAAHAGESGKGFAIVADEIRRLSESTNKSVSDIGKIVNEILKKIEDSVKVAQKAGESLEMINNYSNSNVKIITGLSLAMTEQGNGAKEILTSTQDLVKITEDVKLAMSEQKNATLNFSEAIRELRDLTINNHESTKNFIDKLNNMLNSFLELNRIASLNKDNAKKLHMMVEKFKLEEAKLNQ